MLICVIYKNNKSVNLWLILLLLNIRKNSIPDELLIFRKFCA